MKNKKLLLIIIILIVLFIFILFLLNRRKDFVIDSIESFHFSYDTGWTMDSNVIYDIECKDKCIANIKPNNISDKDKLKIELEDETINEIINILNKYKVSKWDGFNRYDKLVLDGNAFTFDVKMSNGKSISANGYMKWPKNYKEVKNELDTIFLNIYDKNK